MSIVVNYGMVGGSLQGFIGDVHRKAIGLNTQVKLMAGCFSSHEEKNRETAQAYEVAQDRVYANYEEMAKAESSREDGIDFVVITTPNKTHYEIAKTFLEAGIHVCCEKPLCFQVEEALELQALAKEKNLLFGVTYTYSGHNMAKEARELVKGGVIGEIININAEYLQEGHLDDLAGKDGTGRRKTWKMDPEVAGISNCVGDIGTHVEHVIAYITGLRVKKVAAVVDDYGLALDLNANILVEMENGAHGVFAVSKVCAGHGNGLVVRIFGTLGAIEWVQEESNVLYVTRKGEPTQIYQRGMRYNTGRAAAAKRLPSGHPEGFYVAFANIYASFVSAIRKLKNGESLQEEDIDFPTIEDGVAGVKFVHAVIESGKNDSKWIKI